MIWKHLPQDELEQLIGEKVLGQIADIGPALFPEGQTDIYLKSNLVKLANAFITLEKLNSKAFRKLLFNCLQKDLITKIFESAFPEVKKISVEKMRDKLIATAWKDHDYCKKVAAIAGLAEWLIPEKAKILEPSKIVTSSTIPFKQLKSYQFSIFDDTVETLSVQNSRCIIQMPTGSGKTRTAMEIVCHALNKNPSKKVIWIAHSAELCEQAIECFDQIWSHLGQKDVAFVRFWGSTETKHISSPDSRFIACSYAKLGSLSRSDKALLKKLAEECALIVVDEAHMAVAPTYKDLIIELKGNNTSLLGLTATPGRASDASSAELSEFFFNKLHSLKAPNNAPILEYLRAKGVLAHVIHRTLGGASVELTTSQIRKISNDDDFDSELLSTLGQDRGRNLEIIRSLKAEATQGKNILYFAPSVEQSKFICSFLIYLGIPTAHLDGTVSQSQRRAIIERFKRGELRVLCNYGVLATGFDAPKTNVVMIARPTKSIVLYSQMIGRGLRGPAIGGTDHCKVIEVVDNFINLPKFNALHDYFEDYFQDNI